MRGTWLLPVFASFLLLSAFFLNFFADIKTGRPRLLLYLHACGQLNDPLSSGAVDQALNIAAVAIWIIVYLKHRQLVEYFQETRHRRKGKIISSRCFSLFGYLSALALSVAANFPDKAIAEIRIGAFLVLFGSALVYSWFQAIFSFSLPSPMCPGRLAQCRVSFAFFALLFFCGAFAHAFDPTTRLSNGCQEMPEALYWVSVVSECGLAVVLNIFLLTFAKDFWGSKLKAPKFQLPCIEHQPTPFLDTYRLEYLSNSNVNTAKNGPPPESPSASPATARTSVDVVYPQIGTAHESARTAVIAMQSNFAAGTSADQGQPEQQDQDFDHEFYQDHGEFDQDYEQEQREYEPSPAVIAAVSANSYHPSPTSSYLHRHESMNAAPPMQQRTSAFSYIPDMPNPFNLVGQLKKTY